MFDRSSEGGGRLNSRVISLSAKTKKGGRDDEALLIRLHHLDDEGATNGECVSWDRDSSSWTPSGCSSVPEKSYRNSTLCKCESDGGTFALYLSDPRVDVVTAVADLSEGAAVPISSSALSVEIIALLVALAIVIFLLLIIVQVSTLYNPFSRRVSQTSFSLFSSGIRLGERSKTAAAAV